MFKYYVLVLKCRNELIKILQSLVKVSEFIIMLFILVSINFIKIFAERRKNNLEIEGSLLSNLSASTSANLSASTSVYLKHLKPTSQRDQPFNALKRLQDLRK